MALKNLTDEEMAGVSAAWIDPKRTRRVFERHAVLTALLPAVESAHAALSTPAQAAEAAQSAAAMAAIKRRAAEVDRLHDRKARGVQAILLGLIDASDDPAEVATLQGLLTRLNLETLAVIQQTYLGESGNAQNLYVALREDPELRDALKALTLPNKRTVLDLTRQWIAAGQELGALEHQKALIEGELARPSGVPSRSSAAVSARNAWIRMVGAVIANVGLITDLPAQDEEALFTALNRVRRTADGRGIVPGPAPTPDDPT